MFSKVIERETTIAASPWVIWRILSNTAAYGQWNPLYPSAVGSVTDDEGVTLVMRCFSDSPTTFRFRVATVTPLQELALTASFLSPSVVDIVHCLIIAPIDKYQSRFTQGLRISGLAVPFVGNRFVQHAGKALELMTEQVKALAQEQAQRGMEIR